MVYVKIFAKCLCAIYKQSFCSIQIWSCSVPKKHTEGYINYKLFCLLAQAYY